MQHRTRFATEDDVVENLLWDFTGDLCERLKYVKLCHKGDFDGDDDDLLWHFTRLSTLRSMLVGRQIWLTDLASSNDEHEIVYALDRAPAFVDEFTRRWSNVNRAEIVRQVANSAAKRFRSSWHAFAFCLSVERDTVLHWDGYGGGLRNPQDSDPYVSIGFDAQALFHPIELSGETPPLYVINTVNGDDSADRLIQYWAIKARGVLDVLDAQSVPLSTGSALELLQHMLVLACALVKSEGWRYEQEYRLLYVTENFGDEDGALPGRPDGRGRYVPLKWSQDKLPIRLVMPHPLADVEIVRDALRGIPEAKNISVIPSGLRPRPRSGK